VLATKYSDNCTADQEIVTLGSYVRVKFKGPISSSVTSAAICSYIEGYLASVPSYAENKDAIVDCEITRSHWLDNAANRISSVRFDQTAGEGYKKIVSGATSVEIGCPITDKDHGSIFDG
jgi:hypothetical protein